MDPTARHTWIVGTHSADRVRQAGSIGPAPISVSCHRRLRGPYSGICALLNELVPGIYRTRPELAEQYRASILYVAPGLSDTIGPPLTTLTSSTPHEERTRFYGLGLGRSAAHGIITFLTKYSELLSEPPVLFFDHAQHADPAEHEFLELLLRRARREVLHVVVGTAPEPVPEALGRALSHYARRIDVPASPGGPSAARDDDALTRAYVRSDGTSDDLAERTAYLRSEPAFRAARHDERAAELAVSHAPGSLLGAIPYHREHGSDPRGSGCRALLAALEYCVAMGFYDALLDLGERGMALADPVEQQQEYCQFSAKTASAQVALGHPERAERIYLRLRELYALPRVHMSTSYNLAMLYTRWYSPEQKDHNLAKTFCNNAIALAQQERDPELRAFYTVFQSNGLALVEMHRGNLAAALALVTNGIDRLDRELPGDRYLVHRSQLLHNRARVLLALGRLEESLADFARLLAIDPNHAEYYIDRGNAARRIGDHDTALADYDRVCALGPPFPEAYYNRGDVRAAQGDLTGAIADFGYVLDMEPDHLDARVSRAELLIELDDLGAAGADLEAGIARHEDNPELLTLAGLVALLSGEDAKARGCLDQALELDPGLPAAHAHRAVLAARSGEDELAIADITSALAVVGAEAGLLYQRALCHLALGHQAEAGDDLQGLLSLGDSEQAGDARARLAELAGAGTAR
jgi:tetratricopeptide (TPR) repeat protein